MPEHADYDAAIIGGGPAGCAAALTLARQGARVVLFEARAYPHDKLCGEFLSPECASLLESLGAGPALRGAAPVPIDQVEISAPGGAAWQAPLPGRAWGLTRRALDAGLAEAARAAGVELRAPAPVSGLRGSPAEGYALAARGGAIRARLVIAAHGKRGSLDRALNRAHLQRPAPFVALKRHFYGPALPGRIELHAFPGGYCGLSETEQVDSARGRLANLCLLVHSPVFERAGRGPERLPAFLAWLQRQNPGLGDWLACARPAGPAWLSNAQVYFGARSLAENGVLMAGDAAGLIAPLAGDGIAMALRGGQLAGQHAARCLAGDFAPADLARAYAAAWRREFGPRLRLARWLQVPMLHPRLLGVGLRLLRAAPPVGRYLVSHTRGLPAGPTRARGTGPGWPLKEPS